MREARRRPFLATLREFDGRLAVPVADRVRILRELEYDLESLRDHFIGQGMPAAEAHSRAITTLVPDGSSLSDLDGLHLPLYHAITRQLSASRLRLLERTLFAGAALCVVLVETHALLRAGLLASPSVFVGPVLALGGVLVAVIGVTLFHFRITSRLGLDVRTGHILVLAGAILAVGVGGALADSYQLASTLETSPRMAGPLALSWLRRESALLGAALLLAMAGGLAWFVLTQWLASLRSVYRDALGLPDFPTKFGEETE